MSTIIAIIILILGVVGFPLAVVDAFLYRRKCKRYLARVIQAERDAKQLQATCWRLIEAAPEEWILQNLALVFEIPEAVVQKECRDSEDK